MQLCRWIGETAEGAMWGLRFDELLVELRAARDQAEEKSGPVLLAQVALLEHAEIAGTRRGERL